MVWFLFSSKNFLCWIHIVHMPFIMTVCYRHTNILFLLCSFRNVTGIKTLALITQHWYQVLQAQQFITMHTGLAVEFVFSAAAVTTNVNTRQYGQMDSHSPIHHSWSLMLFYSRTRGIMVYHTNGIEGEKDISSYWASRLRTLSARRLDGSSSDSCDNFEYEIPTGKKPPTESK